MSISESAGVLKQGKDDLTLEEQPTIGERSRVLEQSEGTAHCAAAVRPSFVNAWSADADDTMQLTDGRQRPPPELASGSVLHVQLGAPAGLRQPP